jgi:hypothetical protein
LSSPFGGIPDTSPQKFGCRRNKKSDVSAQSAVLDAP